MMKRSSRSIGMTLVEVMVAITIASIVGTLLWQGYAQTAKNKRIIEEDLDRDHVLRIALERMSRELSMAFVSAQRNEASARTTVLTGFVGGDSSGGDRIDFTSFSHQRLYRDSHESDQNELSYFVTRHPEDSSRKVLARREDHRIDDDPQHGGKVEILIDDVEDFQLEYLDPLSGEWLKTWDTLQGAGQPNRLPSQVKIFITVPHPRVKGGKRTYGTRASIALVWGLNHATYNPR